MTDHTNNKPIERIRMGRLSAAIWRQISDEGNQFYNFTVQRSYKNDQGDYQSTESFGLSDALVLAKLADRADTKIRQLLDMDYAASRSEDYDQ